MSKRKAEGKSDREKRWCNNHISGGLVHLGDQYIRYENGFDPAQAARERLLNSLRFDEINLRHNDIIESHDGTFRWIFNDSSPSSFGMWLKNGNGIFLLEGKAGSGKSTLMKFIVNEPRTAEHLDSWAGSNKVTVLKFFFWLSGTQLQRSLKGCLASLLHQILSQDLTAIDRLFDHQSRLFQKVTLADWSVGDISTAFKYVTSTSEQFMALFLDGLDEFDQYDDFNTFADLLEHLQVYKNIKICLSCRPIQQFKARIRFTSMLKLQDLTENDIRQYIEDIFERRSQKLQRDYLDQSKIKRLLDDIQCYAQGVFLWAHLVLENLLLGIANKDKYEVLRQRIDHSPKRIESLYATMYERNFEANAVYKEEARNLFTYATFFPTSVFDLVVARDKLLQDWYMTRMVPYHEGTLISMCEETTQQISKLGSGLLEVTGSYLYVDKKFDPLHKRAISLEVGYAAIEQATKKVSERRDGQIFRYSKLKIQFTHRCARDFILNTNEGKRISGGFCLSQSEISHLNEPLTYARAVERLRPLNSYVVSLISFTPGCASPDHNQLSRKLIEYFYGCNLKRDWSFYMQQSSGKSWPLPVPTDNFGNIVEHGSVIRLKPLLTDSTVPISAYYAAYLLSLQKWEEVMGDHASIVQLFDEMNMDFFTAQPLMINVNQTVVTFIAAPLWTMTNSICNAMRYCCGLKSQDPSPVLTMLVNALLRDQRQGRCLVFVKYCLQFHGRVRHLSFEPVQSRPRCGERSNWMLVETSFADAKYHAMRQLYSTVEDLSRKRRFALVTRVDSSKDSSYSQTRSVCSDVETKIYTLARPADRQILLCHHDGHSWVPSPETTNELLECLNDFCLAEALSSLARDENLRSFHQITLDFCQKIVNILEVTHKRATEVDTISALQEAGCLLHRDAFVVPVDPCEVITTDNWRERGPLRDYYNTSDRQRHTADQENEEDEWQRLVMHEPSIYWVESSN